jgi:hypothetical protein
VGDGVAGQRAVVFHAGALGDFVMVWPLLRAMVGAGTEVTVVAPASHAGLAAEVLGVHGVGSESTWVTALWQERHAGAPIAAELVVTLVADGDDAAAARWRVNAQAALGAREVVGVGPPGSGSRVAAWRRFAVDSHGGAPVRGYAGGSVLMHVGAGSRAKRWPLERWGSLRTWAEEGGSVCRMIAGEVEAERFDAAERAAFAAMDGVFVPDLRSLRREIEAAAVFVGADTGPTHLAAQLGVPTVALFGPTDPGVWGPVGPAVEVVRAAGERLGGLSERPVRAAVGRARSLTTRL